jgi:hypothetical protein
LVKPLEDYFAFLVGCEKFEQSQLDFDVATFEENIQEIYKVLESFVIDIGG